MTLRVTQALDHSRRYHFVGIGGYGMSGLARVLLAAGIRVSGSDVRPSERTERLAALGADVRIGHDAAHVEGADVVVYSTDVPADNAELAAARRLGLEVWHRSELLARLLNPNRGVAVTGTHGKTTTTAMTGLALAAAGLDPTVLVGADVDAFGGTARVGRGEWVVAEACESDGTFLRYRPQVAVATNVEPEHLDHYQGSFDRLVEAFGRFLAGVPAEGLVVVCADDPNLRALAARLDRRVISYGRDPEADVGFRDLTRNGGETRFVAVYRGRPVGTFRLQVPGLHNVVNSLATIAVALALGVPLEPVAETLAQYRGARRRFELVGQVGGVLVVDDYAHHPAEIRATLKAARERAPRRVIAVFQPHRYVRTYYLMDEFSRAFSDADEIVITDLYAPPGEAPIPGVSAEELARRIERHEGRPVHLVPDHAELVETLARLVRPGDLVLTMGAGDVYKVARRLAERLAAAAAE